MGETRAIAIMSEASARRRRRKRLLLGLLGAIVLGAGIWLAVHFIPKPLSWLLPKQEISEVLYMAETQQGTKNIELDEAQQAELIKLLGETRYRRAPICRCDDGMVLFVRYKDGTTAAIGEHWTRIERGESGRSFRTILFGGEALFKHFPEEVFD